MPRRAHSTDAGWDCYANIKSGIHLLAGDRIMVPLGFSLELPDGWEAQVRPRSGLAIKFGITILNAPGTVDAGYRGEVAAIVANLDPRHPYRIDPLDKIAQIVFKRVPEVALVPAVALGDSERGDGGFGSTGP